MQSQLGAGQPHLSHVTLMNAFREEVALVLVGLGLIFYAPVLLMEMDGTFHVTHHTTKMSLPLRMLLVNQTRVDVLY